MRNGTERLEAEEAALDRAYPETRVTGTNLLVEGAPEEHSGQGDQVQRVPGGGRSFSRRRNGKKAFQLEHGDEGAAGNERGGRPGLFGSGGRVQKPWSPARRGMMFISEGRLTSCCLEAGWVAAAGAGSSRCAGQRG